MSILPLGALDSILVPLVGLNAVALSGVIAVAMGTAGHRATSHPATAHLLSHRASAVDDGSVVAPEAKKDRGAEKDEVDYGRPTAALDMYPDDHTCSAYGARNDGALTARKAFDAAKANEIPGLAVALAAAAAAAVSNGCQGAWVPLHPSPGRWMPLEDLSVDTVFGARILVYLRLVGLREAVAGDSPGPSLSMTVDATERASLDPAVARGAGRAILTRLAATCAAQLVSSCGGLVEGDDDAEDVEADRFERLAQRHEVRHVVRLAGRAPDDYVGADGAEARVAAVGVAAIAALRSLRDLAVLRLGPSSSSSSSVAVAFARSVPPPPAVVDATKERDGDALLARELLERRERAATRPAGAAGGVPPAVMERLMGGGGPARPGLRVVPVDPGNPWATRLAAIAPYSVGAKAAEAWSRVEPSTGGGRQMLTWKRVLRTDPHFAPPVIPTEAQEVEYDAAPAVAPVPASVPAPVHATVTVPPASAPASGPPAASPVAGPAAAAPASGKAARKKGRTTLGEHVADTMRLGPDDAEEEARAHARGDAVDAPDAVVYVLGDLDGVDAILFALLHHLKLVEVVGPDELRWLGADHQWVVQCGDQIDSKRTDTRVDIRPTNDLHVLVLTDYLAKISNGRFVSIVGNHEWLNVYHKFDYVSPSHMSPGRAAAFARDALIGRMLRRRRILFRINDAIFSHAGLTSSAIPEQYQSPDRLDAFIGAVNDALRTNDLAFDRALEKLVEKDGVEGAAAQMHARALKGLAHHVHGSPGTHGSPGRRGDPWRGIGRARDHYDTAMYDEGEEEDAWDAAGGGAVRSELEPSVRSVRWADHQGGQLVRVLGGADPDDDDEDEDDDYDDDDEEDEEEEEAEAEGDADAGADADATAKEAARLAEERAKRERKAERDAEFVRLWFRSVWDASLKQSDRRVTAVAPSVQTVYALFGSNPKATKVDDFFACSGLLWTRWLKPELLMADPEHRFDIVPAAYNGKIRLQVTGHNKVGDQAVGLMQMVVERRPKGGSGSAYRETLLNSRIRSLERDEVALVMTDTMPLKADSVSLAYALRYLEMRWDARERRFALASKQYQCEGSCPRIRLAGVLAEAGKVLQTQVRNGSNLWIEASAADAAALAGVAKLREWAAGKGAAAAPAVLKLVTDRATPPLPVADNKDKGKDKDRRGWALATAYETESLRRLGDLNDRMDRLGFARGSKLRAGRPDAVREELVRLVEQCKAVVALADRVSRWIEPTNRAADERPRAAIEFKERVVLAISVAVAAIEAFEAAAAPGADGRLAAEMPKAAKKSTARAPVTEAEVRQAERARVAWIRAYMRKTYWFALSRTLADRAADAKASVGIWSTRAAYG